MSTGAEAALDQAVRLEPRCRVCRNDAVRTKVNDLLAAGSSCAMIVRALEDTNSELGTRDQVTIDSVRNHGSRHFPVQNAAQATYRAILERRAQENKVDFVNAVTTAITPLAYLETVMVRGYESLVSPETKVDVNTAMVAASKLQALVEARVDQAEIAEVFVKQNRIIAAMQEFVPADRMGDFMARLDGVTSADNVSAAGKAQGADEFDPDREFDDEDDDD